MILQEYIDYLKRKNLSQNTVLSYTRDLTQIIKFFEIKNISQFKDIDPIKYRDFIAFLKKKTVSDISLRRKLSAFKSIIKYTTKDTKEKIKFVSIRKVQKKLPKTFSQDVVLKFLNAIKNDPNKKENEKYRNYIVAKIMLILGLRISEVLSIKKNQINQDHIIIKGKGSKQRILPLFDSLRLSIKEFLKTQKPENEYLFQDRDKKHISPRTIQLAFKDACIQTGISNLTPHKLRHSCATEILNNGGSIRKIQALLGHANLSTTQIYSSVSNQKIKSIIKNTLQ